MAFKKVHIEDRELALFVEFLNNLIVLINHEVAAMNSTVIQYFMNKFSSNLTTAVKN